MRVTQNPVAYAWSNPDAKRVLFLVEREGPVAYEQGRKATGLVATAYHRTTRRLAQLDLIRLRAPKGAEFRENRRIRLVMELSPMGRRVLGLVHKLDDVAAKSSPREIRSTVDELLVES